MKRIFIQRNSLLLLQGIIVFDETIFISEIGFRNNANTLYRPWEPGSSEPPDPVEQAAASGAALANILPDPHILGSFFLGMGRLASIQSQRPAGGCRHPSILRVPIKYSARKLDHDPRL